ncbi:ATP-dependent zinc metalloprotease FtsH [Catenulispora subtropica]|uniref:ATP-dependent zinc metalloprotease FtsH n=1 Tax=Catenulispora subtropica TaxID=450798 RepID=A0ABN2RN48_9ACTN
MWPIAIGVMALVWIVTLTNLSSRPADTTLSYSQFLADADAHQVKDITLQSNGTATGTLTNGHTYTTTVPVQLAGSSLLDRLQADNVVINAKASSSSSGSQVLSWVLILAPLVLIIWLWRRLYRGATSQVQGVMGVGKSKAKVFDAEHPQTTFADVAGYEGAKAEIAEVVDFLRQPDRYRRAGAIAPRGVLMVGPPGTGKTLLARAVAGEAAVPFLSVAGSSFVEMFVGVGAARVRDLFAEARKRAPAIVFVDEIDALGGRRMGGGAAVSNDEREQTLNQLLSEMDGFDPAEGIVVLAATNRPDVLDPALLRPGRFDRQVVIPLPTLAERNAILAVHCKSKQLAEDVDLDVVARGTPGFSGADLANLANEAAIAAVRDSREVITADDFDTARDRILLGRREGSNVLLPSEKHAVAVHEAGHALIAALSPHADPVAKVTILPAGQTLGVTEQLPLVERHLHGEDYLTETLAVRLGGRAAELVELGQGSTGAANDLADATELAVKMVREFGLSPILGPVGYPQGGSAFLGARGDQLSSRPYAEATQAAIDTEVARLVREAEQQAVGLLEAHQGKLRQLAALLVEHETIDGPAVYRLLGVQPPSEQPAGTTVAPHGPSPVRQPAAHRTHPTGAGGPTDGAQPREGHDTP